MAVTEWYNPETDQFQLGPSMPVNSVHGLCTTLAPSGLIYMATRRQPEMTRVFTFNLTSEQFDEAPTLDCELRYLCCHVMSYPEFPEVFFIFGGGV